MLDENGNDVYRILSGRDNTAYEGASQKYKEDISKIFDGSPDQILARELLFLQLRSAEAIRNNGYAKNARDYFVGNLGSIKVTWNSQSGKRHTQMQDLWDEFADNPSLDGFGNLDNMQSVWNSSRYETGNTFIRLQIRKDRGRVPLKIETIQSELHDIFYFGKGIVGETVRNGITFIDNKPSEYHFRLNKYREFPNVDNSYSPISIPANEIIHIFDRKSPGQWLGIPELSSVLISLYELDELLDATVARQKASQAISWIIKNSNPTIAVPVGVPIYDRQDKTKVLFKATGTNVQYLNRGEDISFHQGADIGPNFVKLVEVELRRIFNASHVPYYQATGDTSGLDFSSLRALLIDLRNYVEHAHHTITIPLCMSPLTKYFQDIASMYAPGVKNAIPSYQLPRFYGVDDLKDAMADVLEVQNGLATLDSKLQERHTSFEAIKADRLRIKELNLDNLLMPNGSMTNQANNNEANKNSTSN